MTVRLYVVPASHPCAAVDYALRMKGFNYKVTELPTGLHNLPQRLRFGARTVPALKAGGTKITGSKEIMRWLEQERPEPPLWPADPEERAKVERAEEWGEGVLQPAARRLLWWVLKRSPESMGSFLEKSKLPMPAPLLRLSGPAIMKIEWRLNDVSDAAKDADLAAFPGMLEEVDRLIEEGVIGGAQPNAADLQIATSLALLRTVGDLREQIDASRGGELVQRWFADYPGSIPAGVLS